MGIRVGGHGQVFVACGQECAWRGGTFAILPRGETLKEAKRGGWFFKEVAYDDCKQTNVVIPSPTWF